MMVLAETAQVSTVVCSTCTQLNLMVNNLSRGKSTVSQALLTQRVVFNVPVTDALPGFIVSFIYLRVSLILIVVPVHLLFVFSTVLLTTLRILAAAGVRTRTSRFVWHRSSPWYKKSLHGISLSCRLNKFITVINWLDCTY